MKKIITGRPGRGTSKGEAIGHYLAILMKNNNAGLPQRAVRGLSVQFGIPVSRRAFNVGFCAFALAILTFVSCSRETPGPMPAVEPADRVDIERELLQIVNAHRTDLGLIPLQYSPQAYALAREHSGYMISKGNMSHDNFPSRASRLSAETGAGSVGENVARDYPDASTAFGNWYSSTDHRKAMEGDFTHTAASVRMDGEGNLYYTQLFYR